MSLSDSEIGALRFHLGYGSINVGAYPYTPDGFVEVFRDVIAPNLTAGAETSATTAVSAGSIVVVTPLAMTSIVAYASLIVDTGEESETVMVKSVTGSTFTAAFAKAHATSGYPISVDCGKARLRLLLWSADKAWQTVQSSKITRTAGLKSVGMGEVEWFEGGVVLRDTLSHYRAIQSAISSLVRVPVVSSESRGCVRLEAY